MSIGVRHEVPLGDQLAQHRQPAAAVELGAYPKGLEAVVAEAADALSRGADQDIDEGLGPEALAGAVDRGERLLRRDGPVPAVHRVAAVVAVAAGRMIALAEIAEQRLAPARYGFAKADQRL